MIVDVAGSADRVQESLLEIPDHVLEESRGGGWRAVARDREVGTTSILANAVHQIRKSRWGEA